MIQAMSLNADNKLWLGEKLSLWKMIQAMSLNADNKLWLGEKLIEEARKEVAETAPCQYSVEELEHRLGESVQSYRKGDCCTSDELRKRHPICE